MISSVGTLNDGFTTCNRSRLCLIAEMNCKIYLDKYACDFTSPRAPCSCVLPTTHSGTCVLRQRLVYLLYVSAKTSTTFPHAKQKAQLGAYSRASNRLEGVNSFLSSQAPWYYSWPLRHCVF